MNSQNKPADDYYLQQLQLQVWKKAIGNNYITKGNHYYEKISDDILLQTNTSISKDTIRNFLENRHTPSTKTLNIYSNYVLGDAESQHTFLEFKNFAEQQEVVNVQTKPTSFSKHKTRYGSAGLIIFILGCCIAYLTGRGCHSSQALPSFTALTPVLSPKVKLMDRYPLERKDLSLFMDGFKFDSTSYANKEEGRRIIEWFGVEEYVFADWAQPIYAGTLANGCQITVTVGYPSKKNAYIVFHSCKNIDPDFNNIRIAFEKPLKTKPYYERFDHSNLTELQKNDWFLFGDSINVDLWNNPKYKDSGFLTLNTHLGGPWVEDYNTEPKTINILARELGCGTCCEIEVKLVNFNPNERYQQAGFFLFYNESPIPSISFTSVGLSPTMGSKAPGEHRIQAVVRSSKFHNTGILPLKRTLLSKQDSAGKNLSPADSILFKLIVKNDEFFFMYRKNEEIVVPAYSRRLFNGLRPKYIGLTAFQGRPDIPYPVFPVAEVIPAYFEYIRIKPCSNKY